MTLRAVLTGKIPRSLAPALAVLLCVVAAGCEAHADEMRQFTLADLPNASVSPQGTWESQPWTGTPWLRFSDNLTLSLEHSLGRRPYAVWVYIAFDEDGNRSALAAGDLAKVVSVDERVVVIRNGTHGDYYVRVVAQ